MPQSTKKWFFSHSQTPLSCVDEPLPQREDKKIGDKKIFFVFKFGRERGGGLYYGRKGNMDYGKNGNEMKRGQDKKY